jgi:hypothetical protein
MRSGNLESQVALPLKSAYSLLYREWIPPNSYVSWHASLAQITSRTAQEYEWLHAPICPMLFHNFLVVYHTMSEDLWLVLQSV